MTIKSYEIYVDFEPDGDINTIWIEVAHSAIKNKLCF